MAGKRFRATDIETGEVRELENITKNHPYGKDWYMGSRKALKKIIKAKLTNTELNVLMFLLSEVDFGNWVEFNQTYAAEEIGIAQPHVSKAIKSLETKGIIERHPTLKRITKVRLNPDYWMRGTPESAKLTRVK